MNEERGRLEILKEIKQAEIDINRAQNDNALNQLQINKYVDEQKKKVVALGAELKKVNSERLDGLAREQSSLKSMGSIYNALTALEQKRILNQVKSNTLTPVQDAAISKIAEINRDIAQLTADEKLQLIALNEQYSMQMQLLEGIDAENVQLVDNLKLQNTLANTYAKMSSKQKSFLEAQHEVYKGIKNTLMGIFDVAQVATSGLTGGIGTALIGAGMLFDKVADIKKELGEFPNLSLTAMSFFDTNAVSNAKNLASQFGGMNKVTFDMQLSTSLISKNMGISGDEAVDLLAVFTKLNGNSFDTAKNIMIGTKEFAKQNGIIPSKLMSDLAKNTEAFALYAKDGGKNLIEAAGYAQKLGTDLATVVKIGDTLLDFETSINKELELGALLGRNINLDKARSLFFQGEEKKGFEETLKALGGIDAFNKMDRISKKATADLLGLQADELQTMLVNMEKADSMSKTALGTYNAMGESIEAFTTEFGGGFLKVLGSGFLTLGSFAKDMNAINILAENFRKTTVGTFIVEKLRLGLLKLKQAGLFVIRGIMISINAIQSAFIGLLKLEFLTKLRTTAQDKISAGIAFVKTTYQRISNALSNQEFILKNRSFLIEKARTLWQRAGIAIETLRNKIIGQRIALQQKEKATAPKGGGIGGMGGLLKGAASMLLIAAAVFVLGKAFQQFSDINWENVGIGIAAMALLGVVAVAMGAAIKFIGLGAIAMVAIASSFLIFAAAGLVLANAVSILGPALSSVGIGLKSIADVEFTALAGTAGGIVLLASSFFLLAASLTTLLIPLMTALPMLAAIGIGGAMGVGITSLFGDGETTGGGDTTMKELLDEIRGLRNDLTEGKVGVYMDGTKVNMALARVGDRIGTNQYSG
jgi:hypothetical protein